jgi:hypothetical protein
MEMRVARPLTHANDCPQRRSAGAGKQPHASQPFGRSVDEGMMPTRCNASGCERQHLAAF